MPHYTSIYVPWGTHRLPKLLCSPCPNYAVHLWPVLPNTRGILHTQLDLNLPLKARENPPFTWNSYLPSLFSELPYTPIAATAYAAQFLFIPSYAVLFGNINECVLPPLPDRRFICIILYCWRHLPPGLNIQLVKKNLYSLFQTCSRIALNHLMENIVASHIK